MNGLMEMVRPAGEAKAQVAISWRMKGSCRGSDPLVFYPSDEEEALAEQAKAICAGCAVLKQCREFALSTREKHGVWGGLTERDRRRVLRQRRKSA